MPRYSLAGLTILSNIPLPELVEAPPSGLAWTIEFAPDERPATDMTAVHEATTADGEVWLAILRLGDGYLLRFPGSADFVITASERRVECFPDHGAAESTIRHLLLDQVVPLVLSMDGTLVLHASAVAVAGGAIGFIGPSGAGKSSLAASFASQGFPLLCDDFLRLSESPAGFMVSASYPGLRLWPDSIDVFAPPEASLAPVSDNNDKRRLESPPPPEAHRLRPLVALVVLGDALLPVGEAFTLTRIPGREGFMAVFEQAFRMERLGRDRQLAEFGGFARLVESTAFMRLEHRRDYELLPEICTEILRALDEIT